MIDGIPNSNVETVGRLTRQGDALIGTPRSDLDGFEDFSVDHMPHSPLRALGHRATIAASDTPIRGGGARRFLTVESSNTGSLADPPVGFPVLLGASPFEQKSTISVAASSRPLPNHGPVL